MFAISKGTLWAGIFSGGLAQIKTTSAYSNGEITGNEYAAHTTKNVSGALGLMAGLEYGAVLGSAVLPGVGTALGIIAGGILGDRLGSSMGLLVGNTLFKVTQQIPQHPHPDLIKQ